MVNLEQAVRGQCPDVDGALVTRHLGLMPATYWERYSAADIARHLRLLARLEGAHPVEVEIRPLAAHAFEVIVVGTEQSGTLACITAALAACQFDIEDVQVSSYMDSGDAPEDAGPCRFVIVLRVSGSMRGRGLGDLAAELRERLRAAFGHLADGNLLGAQTVAVDAAASVETVDGTASHPTAPSTRTLRYEGLVLGGDFRLESKLATGGMSEVYLASQLSLNRTVAVKLFHHAGEADGELLARFNQEAVVLAQFSCPHIVQILAAGAVPGHAGGALAWMAMEYMAGGDLGGWLQRRGPAGPELATRWLREALEGLLYAHQRGILHRDLKPNNLLVTAEGHLKISDFGLLKHADRPAASLTSEATLRGTPHYMAPEQALGDPLDERSDIFSLGSAFFHLVSGRLPFDRPTATALLVQIANEDAPRLTDVAPQTPRPLAAIIGRMLARHQEERYQEVGVILEDLASYERRGLLNFHEAGAFAAMAPAPGRDPFGIETQAYIPAAGDQDAAVAEGS